MNRVNRAMLENLKKLQRSFYRDYWQRGHSPGHRFTLAREMGICAGIMTAAVGGLSIAFPAMAPALVLFGALTMPFVFAVRLRETKKDMDKTSSAELAHYGADPQARVTITGPSRAVNIVLNTQVMADRLDLDSGEFTPSTKAYNRLVPYFNDCAEAAAQLDATIAGQPVDNFAISRRRSEYEDYKGVREAVQPLLSRSGAEKKQAAERLAAALAAQSTVHGGLSEPMKVKTIKLKAKR